METKNNFILLITEDITITEFIDNKFNNYNIEKYSQKSKPTEFSLIILDDYKLENNDLNKILLNKNILNISKKEYSNIQKLDRPFSLNNLSQTIENLLMNNDKILNFKNFKIITNTLKYENTEVELGNKEIAIIKYLYENLNTTKTKLLNDIWGYTNEIETKVLENTINKIRQKFKSININNFIIFENGKYLINKNYNMYLQK